MIIKILGLPHGSPNIKVKMQKVAICCRASAQRDVTRMQGYKSTFCYCKM